jgi:hypothetical protein
MTTAEATKQVSERLEARAEGSALPPSMVQLRNGGSFMGILQGQDFEYGPEGRFGRAIFTDLNGNILRHVPFDQLMAF